MNFTAVALLLAGTNAISTQRHHHHRRNYGHNYGLSQKQSIPACNSYTFPKCVTEAETAAPTKLQADQDKHDKDYFVPNFGVDHDVITTQSNLSNAEKTLSHKWVIPESAPAFSQVESLQDNEARKGAYKAMVGAVVQNWQGSVQNVSTSMMKLFVGFGVDHLGLTPPTTGPYGQPMPPPGLMQQDANDANLSPEARAYKNMVGNIFNHWQQSVKGFSKDIMSQLITYGDQHLGVAPPTQGPFGGPPPFTSGPPPMANGPPPMVGTNGDGTYQPPMMPDGTVSGPPPMVTPMMPQVWNAPSNAASANAAPAANTTAPQQTGAFNTPPAPAQSAPAQPAANTTQPKAGAFATPAATNAPAAQANTTQPAANTAKAF